MDDVARAKRMGRIRKCLALSRSPEPHEAAAAMRQAQKMMAELGVSPEEVEAPEVGEAVVKTREGYGNCRYMNWLASLVKDAFGVRVVYSRNPGTANRLNVKYIGPKDRVLLAEYTHAVLQRSLEAAWTEFLTANPQEKGVGGVRQSFYIGWLLAVDRQVTAMVPPEAEVLATDRFVALRYGQLDEVKGRKQADLDPYMLRAGTEAAEGFSIRTPMTQEQLKLGQS